jgi:hypothetical protein
MGVARVQLFGAAEAGWRIGQPLPVTVRRREDGSYVVTDDVFGVFGEGDSWNDAERDLVASLVDTFLLLAEATDEPTQALVQHFRTYIHPIQP